MLNIIEATASAQDNGIKIRDFLKRRMSFSTSLIAKVKYGGVMINGNVVHMRAILNVGDKVTVRLPSERSDINPISLPLNVLYEDDDILAIGKPTNMPVHPSRGNHLPTLAEGVMAYVGADFVFRAVNRLDRDTSGIVLIAKNQPAASRLCKAMKDGAFKKVYYARVSGVPKPEKGVIDAPIEREKEGSIKRVVINSGKPSVTEYEVLSVNEAGDALCRITPRTGRTHQIRVHLAYVGHPLVNDFLYGSRAEGKTYSLHCGELCFPHPKSGEGVRISCELPDSF